MILLPSRTSSKFKSGFGLMEIIIGIMIAGIFAGFSISFLRKQASDRRLAEAKVAVQLLHNRAQQAVKRYMSFNLDAFIDANAALKNCFEAKGNSCETLKTNPPPFVGFPSAGAGTREDEMNKMMNGDYFYSGRPCPGANCPVRVSTTWDFSCQGSSCDLITFSTNVVSNVNNAANEEEKSLFSSLAPLSSETIYNKTKRVGLLRALSAKCDVPTEANLVARSMGCDTNVVPNNPNEIFDSNIGFNFLNSDLQLVPGGGGGGNSGGITGLPPDPCPTCTRAVMTDNGLECRPSVFCTNPGWVVRDCKCCQPNIPGGGDGWGSWGACSTPCAPGGGTQSRSCQYPKEQYCDSVCSAGQTQTRSCSLPNATTSWGNWGSCSKTCGGGTQTRACTQPRGQFCNSTCNSGDTQSRACNTNKCEESKSIMINFGPSTASKSESLYCSSGYSLDEATYSGTQDPCRIRKSSSSATITCRKNNIGNCLPSGICDARFVIKCSK